MVDLLDLEVSRIHHVVFGGLYSLNIGTDRTSSWGILASGFVYPAILPNTDRTGRFLAAPEGLPESLRSLPCGGVNPSAPDTLLRTVGELGSNRGGFGGCGVIGG